MAPASHSRGSGPAEQTEDSIRMATRPSEAKPLATAAAAAQSGMPTTETPLLEIPAAAAVSAMAISRPHSQGNEATSRAGTAAAVGMALEGDAKCPSPGILHAPVMSLIDAGRASMGEAALPTTSVPAAGTAAPLLCTARPLLPHVQGTCTPQQPAKVLQAVEQATDSRRSNQVLISAPIPAAAATALQYKACLRPRRAPQNSAAQPSKSVLNNSTTKGRARLTQAASSMGAPSEDDASDTASDSSSDASAAPADSNASSLLQDGQDESKVQHFPSEMLVANSAGAKEWWPRLQHPFVCNSDTTRTDVSRAVQDAVACQPVLSEALLPIVDILLVHRRTKDELEELVADLKKHHPSRYCARSLHHRHGFRVLQRSTVVSDINGDILLIFVTATDLQQLNLHGASVPEPQQQGNLNVANVPAAQQQLLTNMAACHRAVQSRDDSGNLYTTGLRYSPYELTHGPLGTFAMLQTEDARKAQPELKASLQEVATFIAKAEKAVAPQAAAARRAVAEAIGLPYGPGGVPVEQCPATALGCSSSYVSSLHQDDPACNIYETIIFSHQDMHKETGWSFTSAAAGVLVDLQVAPCCLVMVPGTTTHGTPWVDSAETHVDHGGIGTVLFNKEKLCAPKLEPALKELWTQMLDNPNFQGCVHLKDVLTHRAVKKLNAKQRKGIAEQLRQLTDFLKKQEKYAEIQKQLPSFLDNWDAMLVPKEDPSQQDLYLYHHPDVPNEVCDSPKDVYKRSQGIVLGGEGGNFRIRRILSHYKDSRGVVHYRVQWLGWPEPPVLACVGSINDEVANWVKSTDSNNFFDILCVYAKEKGLDINYEKLDLVVGAQDHSGCSKKEKMVYAALEAAAMEGSKGRKRGASSTASEQKAKRRKTVVKREASTAAAAGDGHASSSQQAAAEHDGIQHNGSATQAQHTHRPAVNMGNVPALAAGTSRQQLSPAAQALQQSPVHVRPGKVSAVLAARHTSISALFSQSPPPAVAVQSVAPGVSVEHAVPVQHAVPAALQPAAPIARQLAAVRPAKPVAVQPRLRSHQAGTLDRVAPAPQRLLMPQAAATITSVAGDNVAPLQQANHHQRPPPSMQCDNQPEVIDLTGDD